MNSPDRTWTPCVQNLLFSVSVALLAACSNPTPPLDNSTKGSVAKRYETVQTLASHDQYLVGGTQTGVVTLSDDAGKSWRRIEVSKSASFVDSAFCPSGQAVLLDVYHKVWVSDGNYTNWTPLNFDKPRSPVALSCDASGLWVAGSGSVLSRSLDFGKTWTVTSFDKDAQFTAIRFASPLVGYALGEFGMLAKTTDGGKSWNLLAPVPADFYSYDLLTLDENKLLITGIAGQVLQSTNGGKSWTRTDNSTGSALYHFARMNDKILAVGANGVVAQWVNQRWQTVSYPNPVRSFLGAVAPISSLNRLVVGGPNGLLFEVSPTEAKS